MTPLAIGMPGLPELIIILVVVLLLFGGTRLAGLGKSTGRAIKEFKDETKGLRDKPEGKAAEGEVVDDTTTTHVDPAPGTTEHQTPTVQPQTPTQPTAADPRRDV